MAFLRKRGNSKEGKKMKKAILTTAVMLVLLLAGLSAVTAMETVSVEKRPTTTQITGEPIEISKLVENRHRGHWFFCADIDSSGYAKNAVIRCYDGIISVTYYNGVTTINTPFKTKTFTGAHKIEIYGFGGTKSWSGSVTNKDIAFAGFIMVCFVQPL